MNEAQAQALAQKVIEDIAFRFEESAKKYGAHENVYEALGALLLEVDEVKEAIQQREAWKVREEMLDVANVCLRWAVKHDTEKALEKKKRQNREHS